MPGGLPCCFNPIESVAALRGCCRCLACKYPSTDGLERMSEQATALLTRVPTKTPMRFREGVALAGFI